MVFLLEKIPVGFRILWEINVFNALVSRPIGRKQHPCLGHDN